MNRKQDKMVIITPNHRVINTIMVSGGWNNGSGSWASNLGTWKGGFAIRREKLQSLSDVYIGYKLLIIKGKLEWSKKSLSRVFPR